MKSRMRILALLVVAVWFIPPGAARAESRSCCWTNVERIVAVGDVHGDFERFALLLRAAGVVNERHAWIGGRTHLVQVGDVLDRGPESKKAMDLLMALEGPAEKAGGRVHALIGNHEAMVLTGDYAFLHPGEVEAMGGMDGLIRAMGPNGVYGKWIRGNNAVIRINDVLFLHAGLSPAYATNTLPQLNDEIRRELAMDEPPSNGILTASDGPLWYRGYALKSEEALAPELQEICDAFSAARVVVGHTVQKGGIRTRCGGTVVMIDVGMSRSYVGADPACLLIERGGLFVVTPGARTRLGITRWSGRPLGINAPRR